MIISDEHRFIFFCNGKTGTTSIEKSLEPFQQAHEYNHICRQVLLAKHAAPAFVRGCFPREVWDSYFKIVFVRNPWDWFVSQWRYNLTEHAKLNRRARIRESRLAWFRKKQAFVDALRRSEEYKIDADDVDALFEYLKIYRVFPGSRGYMQSDYVFDSDGNKVVDYVGRFESLPEDFSQICRQIGIQSTLPHLNGSGPRTDYQALFSEDGRERVAQLWAEDIKNFGYQFNGGGSNVS